MAAASDDAYTALPSAYDEFVPSSKPLLAPIFRSPTAAAKMASELVSSLESANDQHLAGSDSVHGTDPGEAAAAAGATVRILSVMLACAPKSVRKGFVRSMGSSLRKLSERVGAEQAQAAEDGSTRCSSPLLGCHGNIAELATKAEALVG